MVKRDGEEVGVVERCGYERWEGGGRGERKSKSLASRGTHLPSFPYNDFPNNENCFFENKFPPFYFPYQVSSSGGGNFNVFELITKRLCLYRIQSLFLSSFLHKPQVCHKSCLRSTQNADTY